MKYVLKEMTDEEKPREKLKKYGPKSLTDYELLAVILKTGTIDKSVIDLSIEVLEYLNGLAFLSDITLKELVSIKGIGEAKALGLIASLELSNRLLKGNDDNIVLNNSLDIYNYIKYDLFNLHQEHLYCLYLDSKKRVILKKEITIGSLTATQPDIKSCIRWGLKVACFGIVFVHNHPSGDPRPSQSDILITRQFMLALRSVDIAFVEHLIVGKNSYYSFANEKYVDLDENNFE